MKRRILSSLAGLLLVASCLAPALAQTPAPPPPNAPPPTAQTPQAQLHGPWDYQKEIGLSDQQVATMKQDWTAFITERTNTLKKAQSMQADLKQLIDKESAISVVRPRFQALANLGVELQIDQLKTNRAVTKVMTPDQVKKLKIILAQRRTNRPPTSSLLPHH